MQKFYRLDNGLRVYLWQWPATSVGIAVTIDSGSRHDPLPTMLNRLIKRRAEQPLYGLNHAFEHLTARASRKWPTWEALTEHADGTCTDQNAETDNTTVALYAATDRQHAGATVEFLGDMVLHPIISQENFVTEQQRVIEEYREYADQPNERASLMFDQMMFDGDGLAHPILGTEESIRRITIADIRNYRRRVICGERLIITVTGNFHPDRIMAAIKKVFGRLAAGTPRETPLLDFRKIGSGIRLVPAQTNQVYCILGFPMFGINDQRRAALGILHNHISGSTRGSSRIKVAISSKGFGYSALDGYMHWPDVGQWHLDIPVSPEKFLEMLARVAGVIGEARRKLIEPRYHDLAVTNLSISAKGRFGDPLRTATFVGAFIANAGTFTPLRRYLHDIRNVTRRQVLRAARTIFVHKRLCLVAHGPINGITKTAVRKALSWPT